MKTKITFIIVVLTTVILLTNAKSARAATWMQKADMPTARLFFTTSVVDGKIYSIGGIASPKKVEEYDPATEIWTQKADLPTGRVWIASSAVNGKIYAIGGSTSWGGTNLATVEEYDPATDAWTRKADMPAPRESLSTSVVNGKIYAIGGYRGGRQLSTVEEYDPATDTWTKKTDMPAARDVVSTSVVDGKIYAVGGQSENQWPAFSTVEEYDPVTDTWTQKADMPAPRSALSTSVVNGKIYAFGGTARRGGAPQSTFFQYDPAMDTWTVQDDMPVRMLGMSTSVVGGRIYIIGGTSASYPYSSRLSTVWEYDTGLGVPSPDFNGDGIVDNVDVSILIDHWHTDNELYDIAPEPWGDGIVDVQDLILISEHLFEEILPESLVAYWKLDETEGDIAYDSAGGNFGTLSGNPIWQPDSGQIAGALQFDGLDDYISTDKVLNPKFAEFSVFAWIKGGSPGQVIISQKTSFGGVGATWLGIDPLNGCLMTELVSPPIGRFIAEPLESNFIITDDIWHHVGFVWDGSYRTLYVDGMEVARDVNPLTSLNNSDGGLFIGVNKNLEAGTFFSGLIDDVRIYNKALSVEEIESLTP